MYWSPERIFYSHATIDNEITKRVLKCAEKLDKNYAVYVADRKITGIPLMEKLRQEIYNSNALLLSWTDNCSKTNSNQIISFELGMAYSLGIPIYLLKFTKDKLPWFYDQLTDYESLSDDSEDLIFNKLKKLDLSKFYNPIDILIPNEELPKYGKNQSKNIEVVQKDGTLKLTTPFNGIIHFRLVNRRLKPEKNVRIIIEFPNQVKILFDAGSINGSTGVQRNELFEMIKYSKKAVRMVWESLPSESFNFELRLIVDKPEETLLDKIKITVSSESFNGWRLKEIPLVIA